jgi:uncharacterized protein (TIGR02996 family)
MTTAASPDSPQLHALLRACKETPLDDLPRLVLADWLEEQGDADRAEFVRTQVRLAALPWYEPEVPELEARQAELLRQHGEAWLASPRATGLPGCCFRRGMIVTQGRPVDFRGVLSPPGPEEQAVLSWVDTLAARDSGLPRDERHAAAWEALFASPLLSHLGCLRLGIQRLQGSLLALAHSPHLANVRDLALTGGSGGCNPQEVIELARGSLAGLRRLYLSPSSVQDAELAALLAPPHFPRLEQFSLATRARRWEETVATLAAPRPLPWQSLRLDASGVRAYTIGRLFGSPNLAGLTDLALHGPGRLGKSTSSGEEVLAATSHITRLQTLRIPFAAIDDVRGLASAPLLTGVRNLELKFAAMRPHVLGLLLQSPHLGRLEVLNLHANGLGDGGARDLAKSPVLAGLRVLILSNNGIGPSGAAELAQSPHLAGLQVLDLFDNPLGPEGWAVLAASPHWRGLRMLSLGKTGPQLAGAKALAASPILREVRRLLLPGNRLSAGHLRALLRSPHLGPLAALNVQDNRLDEKAIRVLADSPTLAGLRELNVATSAIDEAGARLLLASPHLNRLALLGSMFPGLPAPAHEILSERFGKDMRGLVFQEGQYRAED